MTRIVVCEEGGPGLIDLGAVIEPRPLVAALDEAFGGYFNEFEVRSAIWMEADCPDLCPALHEAFAGQIATREEFHYFNAWLELAAERDPSILSRVYDLCPRVLTTLH